jgi:hypothetical protein
MAIEEIIPIVTTAGAWAWSKYKDDIIDSLLKKLGAKAKAQAVERTKSIWERVQWELAAKKYLNKIQLLYSTIKILGKSEPVSLEGIFTDVFILDKPTAFRRYDIKQLTQDPSEVERHAKRVGGLELVGEKKDAKRKRKQEANYRLFILGKPGAGKTTFLKYLALHATKGSLDSIPIFVSLKEWADSGLALMPFINKQFEICDFPDAEPFVEHVLNKGDVIVLFDGLDEVNQEGKQRDKMIAELRDFSRKYWYTQCLITCRIAATDYSFDYFTYVELADFNKEQIYTFAAKWFKDDPRKYELFRKELEKPEHKGLQDMASVPLLLALLCLSFDATLTFPQRRVEIYDEAIEALLKKWDSSRSIKRDEIYRGLSHGRKRQMFARIAALTFQASEYFVPQDKLAGYIVDYLRQLPDTEAGSDIDGEAILKSIEAQHGIFTERAHRIYSFSHLTFQEYLTAKHIVDDTSGRALKALLDTPHTYDDRWREVILMTASLLNNADGFFHHFQRSIINIISDNEYLAELLEWTDEKSRVLDTPEGRVTARLIYLYISLAFYWDHTLDRERARARQVAYERARELGLTVGFDLDSLLRHSTALPFALNDSVAKNQAVDLERYFDIEKELKFDAASSIHPSLALDFHLAKFLYTFRLTLLLSGEASRRGSISKLAAYYALVRQKYKSDLGSEVEDLLKNSAAQLSNLKDSELANFADAFRDTVMQRYNLRYERRLSKTEIESLTQFVTASRLLYQCMQLAAVADRKSLVERLLSLRDLPVIATD